MLSLKVIIKKLMLERNQKYDIESKYDEELVTSAEVLFEEKKIKEITRLEQGLYVIQFKNKEKNEVEILKPFTKSQKSTCDCSTYRERNVCEHILAALMALRKEAIAKELEAKSKKETTKNKRPSKLGISGILAQIEFEELKNFIASYASKNPRFSTALKVNFARKIELEDNYSKYKNLLDSIIKPVTTKSKSISNADVNLLINVSKDLSGQFLDAEALHQYLEAYLIAENVINKIEYTRYHFGSNDKELTNMSRQFHSHLISLLKNKIAPELRGRIKEYLLKLITLSYYNFTDAILNPAFLLLDYFNLKKEEKELILSQLMTKISASNVKYDQLPILLALIQVLNFQVYKKSTKIAPSHLKYTIEILDNLIKMGQLDAAHELADLLIKSDNTSRNLHFKMLEILILREEYDEFMDQAAKAFLTFKDFRIIDSILKAMNDEQKDMVFKQIAQSLENSDEVYFVAKFLLKIGYKQELLDLIKQESDMRLLMSYSHYLLPEYPQEIEDMYLNLTKEFLDNHIGQHSNHFITEISQHLSTIGADKILKKLNKMILENFNHRAYFISEFK